MFVYRCCGCGTTYLVLPHKAFGQILTSQRERGSSSDSAQAEPLPVAKANVKACLIKVKIKCPENFYMAQNKPRNSH